MIHLHVVDDQIIDIGRIHKSFDPGDHFRVKFGLYRVDQCRFFTFYKVSIVS